MAGRRKVRTDLPRTPHHTPPRVQASMHALHLRLDPLPAVFLDAASVSTRAIPLLCFFPGRGRGCSPHAKAKAARLRSPRAAVIFVGMTLCHDVPPRVRPSNSYSRSHPHTHTLTTNFLSQIASASPRVAPVSKPPRAHPPYHITPITKRAPRAERVDSARTGSRSQHPSLHALSTAHGTPRLAHGPPGDPSSQVSQKRESKEYAGGVCTHLHCLIPVLALGL
ncbi:hypothetical protein K438DRAFT_261789 [Mycena galopus ATCC 62051]|nr:hypothetical protein K438DRAFT_261789 [Mycena galopus ATCC 62051]